jgi:hypothetical protein
MISGSRGAWQWIVWESQFLSDLVAAFPGVVCGRHVAITAFDSGRFLPTPDLTKRGWSYALGVAYSPPVEHRIDLPVHQYDEWYAFRSPSRIGYPEVFVNYGGFRLDCADREPERREMVERFWRQLESLQPESYLAEGDYLIFVTRNPVLFGDALLWKPPRPEERSPSDSGKKPFLRKR